MLKRAQFYNIFACVYLFFIFVAGCATVPAGEPLPEGASAKEPTLAGRYPDEVVCRNIRPIGSYIGERVCMTVAQWERSSEESRKAVETVQRTSGINAQKDE
jgi:hypothetical protein